MKSGSVLVYTLLMFAVAAIFAISLVVSSSSVTMQSVRHLDTFQNRKMEKLYANNLLQLGASWFVDNSLSFSSCDATAISLLSGLRDRVENDPADGDLWVNVVEDASSNGRCADLTDELGPIIDTLAATGALPSDRERLVYAFKLSAHYGKRLLIVSKVGSTFSWALGVGKKISSPFFDSLFHTESGLDLYRASNVRFDGPIETTGDIVLSGGQETTFEDLRTNGDIVVANGRNITFHGVLETKGDLMVTNRSNNVHFEGDVAVESALSVVGRSRNITFHSTVTLTQDPYISSDSDVNFETGYQIDSGLSIDPVATVLQSFPIGDYFADLKDQSEELSRLWENPPGEPVGIEVPGLAVIAFEYEGPMQKVGIFDFDNFTYYELVYDPSSGSPYHAEIVKYSLFGGGESKSFEFTGLILGDELVVYDLFSFIWSGNWLTLEGPLTLAARSNLWIFQDIKYAFLPNNPHLWKSAAETSGDTTLLTMVSMGDINVLTQRIVGSLTSFLGNVDLWYGSNVTIFGNVVERFSTDLRRRSNLSFIFDPRLSEASVTHIDHPGDYVGGSSTGGIDLR